LVDNGLHSQAWESPQLLLQKGFDVRNPTLARLGLVELGKRSIKKAYLEDDILMYAAALAFRAFLALIPFLVFLVALLGFLRVPGFFEWLLGKAQNVLSEEAMGQAKLVLGQVRDQARGGFLAIAAVVVAIWYASVGVRSLMSALNVAYDTEEGRPAWKRYPLSIFLTVALAVTIALTSALLLVGSRALEELMSRVGAGEGFVGVWAWVRWPAAVLLLMLAVALIYNLGPDVDEPFRFVTPGAVLAVVVWIAASLGFHYYLLNFVNYSVMYGSLGAVLMLLLYFYVLAAVLLLGAETNAVIDEVSKEKRTGS
jgi:membrane protein